MTASSNQTPEAKPRVTFLRSSLLRLRIISLLVLIAAILIGVDTLLGTHEVLGFAYLLTLVFGVSGWAAIAIAFGVETVGLGLVLCLVAYLSDSNAAKASNK